MSGKLSGVGVLGQHPAANSAQSHYAGGVDPQGIMAMLGAQATDGELRVFAVEHNHQWAAYGVVFRPGTMQPLISHKWFTSDGEAMHETLFKLRGEYPAGSIMVCEPMDPHGNRKPLHVFTWGVDEGSSDVKAE